jgi:hypothetical protein
VAENRKRVQQSPRMKRANARVGSLAEGVERLASCAFASTADICPRDGYINFMPERRSRNA